MTDTRARGILTIGDALSDRRRGLNALWQEIAFNCYVERADFTGESSEGAEFAAHLFASDPSLARRELGNAYAAILRPTATPWFEAHVYDEATDCSGAARLPGGRHRDHAAGGV